MQTIEDAEIAKKHAVGDKKWKYNLEWPLILSNRIR